MPLPNSNKGSSLFGRVSAAKTQSGSKPQGLPNTPLRGIKMGNGASSASTNADGDSHDHVNSKKLNSDLRGEIKWRDVKLQKYESDLQEKTKVLEEKCLEISKLRAEVDKLQSVLQIKVHKDAGKPDILSTIQENATMAGQENRSKKQGVSGESPMSSQNGAVIEIKHFEKEFRYVLISFNQNTYTFL